MVDTLGLLLPVVVTEGHLGDRRAAWWLLRCAQANAVRLQWVWTDRGYREYRQWAIIFYHTGVWVEIAPRSAHSPSLSKRWIVEGTFAWFGHARRLSKDYEYYLKSSASMIYATMIRLMLRWLAPPPTPS